MKRVYIAGALTNAEEKNFYELLGEVVNIHEGFSAYLPHLHSDPVTHAHLTAEEVYEMDRALVLASDLVLLCANLPSFGVGMEAEIATSNNIPILVLHRQEIKVSRMILGAPTLARVISYNTEDEALEGTSDFLATFN